MFKTRSQGQSLETYKAQSRPYLHPIFVKQIQYTYLHHTFAKSKTGLSCVSIKSPSIFMICYQESNTNHSSKFMKNLVIIVDATFFIQLSLKCSEQSSSYSQFELGSHGFKTEVTLSICRYKRVIMALDCLPEFMQ